MKRMSTQLGASHKPKKTLFGPIDLSTMVLKHTPKWVYDYLNRRDNDIFAALARADSEGD